MLPTLRFQVSNYIKVSKFDLHLFKFVARYFSTCWGTHSKFKLVLCNSMICNYNYTVQTVDKPQLMDYTLAIP